ncbi:DMT family transporter [Leuconostoc gasicomitatum]|uniref:DMT family transporter n=1 Tax=Leuconostoc gasicomitatum TaxID=115778 RepID=UPI000BDC7322|nr:DMT family transporter [Leuconostoc gasicomitatum]SOB97305.1 membrane hypothetical protein [Leuconostoc gasicomitatum]
MYLIYIGLAVVTGLTLAAETALNAQLSALLKSPIIACFVAYTVGTIILFCMTIMIGDFQKIQNLFSTPILPLTGGLFGLIFVMSCIILFQRLVRLRQLCCQRWDKFYQGCFLKQLVGSVCQ